MRVDLRSDTVTVPTEKMRKAMYEAEVGDDVFGEDPTVNRLQELAAEICGREAALFVPSGTMANQVCVRVQAPRGSEVILEEESHIFLHEVGGLAALAQVQTRLLKGVKGIIQPRDLIPLFRPSGDIHAPRTSLVCIEQTSMMAGGTIYPLETIKEICDLTHERGARVHMDGARLFNAAVASGISPRDFAQPVDSLMFCLSKGLGCPVGSMIVGDKDFIEEARVARKLYGGGMRQAGVLAACGIVALTEMVDRLAEDHEKARIIAEAIEGSPIVDPEWNRPQTNIIIFPLKEPRAGELVQKLAQRGVLCLDLDDRRIRMVTHKDVSFEEVRFAAEVLGELLH
ncbi:MAG: aminotransferase class I/II-fold pyridoxal phosphate-dependent enzyme [Caldiserica bacterium]|jgi:threonine aldolase|nr:aminotransferase class I/II-fold pyridoxal phosphate-dependent enzyme [Caldisericota bacterium]MDH7561978.1 GntG family PLP-dependent aldolase [Caldisericota bacterium]